MLRIILINLFVLLLPSIIYFAYVLFVKRQSNEEAVSDAPVLILFVTGVLLMLASIAYFIEFSGGKPGQKYYPPQIKDGVIIPGRNE